MRLRSFSTLLIAVFFLSHFAVALEINSTLPDKDITLKTTEGAKGRLVRFKDLFKGTKGIAIVFVSAQCPYSKAYNARYSELNTKFRKQGVAFIAVNSNVTEPWDKVKEHAEAKEQAYNFPVYKDEGYQLADLLGANRTPEAFLFNAEKKLLYHGRIDSDAEGTDPKRKEDLINAANEMTATPFRGITVAETKFFGCTIKKK